MDRFEIGERVAVGGMGSIHRALDRTTGRPVALKLLDAIEDKDRARFEREAAALARLSHPNIVRYLAHGSTSDGVPYIAMEWIDGESLGDHLDDGISVADAVAVIRYVALALAEAHHAGLVHRDIKPANVMLAAGDSFAARVRVVDFGLARRVVGEHKVTQTGMAVGTPGYMAPEQVQGQREVDGRLDQFGLGCVLHDCLAGHAPFDGEHPLAVQMKVLLAPPPPLPPRVPAGLARVVERMLAKAPAERYADMTALVAALDALGPLPRTVCTRLGRHGEHAPPTVVEAAAPCLVLASVRAPDDAWRARAAAVHRCAEMLRDGTLIVREPDATLAARSALALAAALPDATVVVAASRPARDVADVVDRGTRVMSVAALRAVFARGAAAGRVHVDPETAGRLRGDFEIVEDGPLLVLRERSP